MNSVTVRDHRGKIIAHYHIDNVKFHNPYDLKRVYDEWRDLNKKQPIKQEYKISYN